MLLGDAIDDEITRLEQSKSGCSGGEGGAQECMAAIDRQIAVQRALIGRIATARAAPAPAVVAVPVYKTGTAPRKTPAPEARTWDDESVRAAVGPDFSAAVYFRDHPDVAADAWASQNPERHWLAYGMAAGYAFPMPDAPAPAVQVKTVYQVPTPPAASSVFPVPAATSAAQATPVATPAPSQTPVYAYPMTGSPPLQSGFAPSERAAPRAAGAPASALPSWAIPAAIGAAALLLLPVLLKPKRASR